MIELYHGAGSVCSSKVRLGLAEKGVDWVSRPINLQASEQSSPEYLELNPNGVVPTLVQDDLVVVESSVILEYVDTLSEDNPLMPSDDRAKAIARVWLVRCLDIHAAINTMSFTTVHRQRLLAKKSPEQLEDYITKIANPANAAKRRDLIENGVGSTNMYAAFFTLRRMFDDMQTALENGPWLMGQQYGIVDTALLSYVDRLDNLGMSGLWETRTPAVGTWLEASRARPSYAAAFDDYFPETERNSMKAEGVPLWPAVQEQWLAFLEK